MKQHEKTLILFLRVLDQDIAVSLCLGMSISCIFSSFPPHFFPFCLKMRKRDKKHAMKHIWISNQNARHIFAGLSIHHSQFHNTFSFTFLNFCSVKHLPTNLIRVHPFLSFFTRTSSVTVLAQLQTAHSSGTRNGTKNAETE